MLQLLGPPDRLAGLRRIREDHELVTGHAGEHVVRRAVLGQASRHGRQQVVADGVAVGVVDGLEGVQVERHQRQGRTTTRGGQTPVEGVPQAVAVAQPGEDVTRGAPPQLALELERAHDLGGRVHEGVGGLPGGTGQDGAARREGDVAVRTDAVGLLAAAGLVGDRPVVRLPQGRELVGEDVGDGVDLGLAAEPLAGGVELLGDPALVGRATLDGQVHEHDGEQRVAEQRPQQGALGAERDRARREPDGHELRHDPRDRAGEGRGVLTLAVEDAADPHGDLAEEVLREDPRERGEDHVPGHVLRRRASGEVVDAGRRAARDPSDADVEGRVQPGEAPPQAGPQGDRDGGHDIAPVRGDGEQGSGEQRLREVPDEGPRHPDAAQDEGRDDHQDDHAAGDVGRGGREHLTGEAHGQREG